jgi:hypothetical protein
LFWRHGNPSPVGTQPRKNRHCRRPHRSLGYQTPKQFAAAQVAVNQHVLDEFSPVDFVLDPGNYVLDITLTG